MNARKEVPSDRKDPSDLFHSVLLWCGNHKLNILDHNIQVSPRGIVFKTDSYFAPFTDLRVRLKLPPRLGVMNNQTIQCDGVVVECRGSHAKKIYFVTVAFVNLSESEQKILSTANSFPPAAVSPVRPQNRSIRSSF
jgi:hypothetical protein